MHICGKYLFTSLLVGLFLDLLWNEIVIAKHYEMINYE